MEIRRGDVVLTKLPEGKGSVQSGYRPCLVVQNNTGNKFSSLCLVVPITSSHTKKSLPTHVEYTHLNSHGEIVENIVLCEQIFTVLKTELKRPKMGGARMTDEVMTQVDEALKISLGIK